jgi:putative DNA primase/helicase
MEAVSAAKLNPLLLNKSLVGFRNGVWDFSNFDAPVYHPFSDRMEVTCLLPYDYDPRSECPVWESFLASVLTPNQRDLLQKYLGLGCIDRKLMGRKVESTLWLIGPGANGKSVIFDTVLGVFGKENVSSVGLSSLIGGNADSRARFLGEIVGKTFNYCTEIQAEAIGGSSDAFKALCSGEPQVVKRLYKDIDTSYDIPYLIFNMNQKPVFRKLDEAIVRRLLFIKFRTTVREMDRNPNLSNELAKEYSGIRNWMMDGYRKFVAAGYRLTATSESAAEERETLIENGRTVHVFVRDNGLRSGLSAGNWREKPKLLLASQFYNDYVAFCQRNEMDVVTLNQFGRDLKVLGFVKKRLNVGNIWYVYSDHDIPYKIQ